MGKGFDMAVIVVKFFGVSSVSAPSALYIEDTAGNGSSGGDRYTTTISGTPTDNLPFDPLMVQASSVITLGFVSGFTGSATSYSWAINAIDNGAGVISSVSATSATTANFNPVFTVSGGASGGQQALYDFTMEITNSGGTSAHSVQLLFIAQ
tara:strand:- start:1757 stop:2212 length:456 start_codon:yes stop_codon:yes gene_type:complete